MTALNEQQFIDATHAVASSILDAFAAYGLDRQDAANVAGGGYSAPDRPFRSMRTPARHCG